MFKQGDRVVLQSDFKYHVTEVKAGTIGTVTMLLNDDTVIVRYGYDHFKNKQLVIGISSNLLKSADIDSLSTVEYEKLVSPSYHIGQKVIAGLGVSLEDIKTGDVGTIIDYQLALNENNDNLTIQFDKNETLKNHIFKMSFVETYYNPYSEEFEKQLGEQIDFKTVKKNYHLIGARMFLKEESPDNVVIITNKENDEKFEVEDLKGITSIVSKEELLPITSLEFFASVGYSNFVRKEFSIGKRFIAKKGISNYALLNDEFKCGDVVEIIHINEIFINSYDDTVVIERTGGSAIVVSVLELKNYFEPFKGMVKKSMGQIISKSNDLEEIEEQISNESSKEDKVVLMMPIVNEVDKDFIQINDITINGFKFTIENSVVSMNYEHEVTVDDLDSFIRSLTILKEYVKGR